ncbi:AAA domain-containing protein [Agrobacterium rosae]|uniref:DNA2/NAM7 helicase-like C-terminal domain-containing protein n=1 Tax=Agrobacterium rosae TaxID=1972867 RepID=A0A1R3U4H0_9HYPH|nr:hypothetical protein DSM25559_4512 [Agrobacterium rosae]
MPRIHSATSRALFRQPQRSPAARRQGWIAALRVVSPDVFIITPFKIIETEMRRRLERERDIFKAIGEYADDWSRNRVGTVHTFQGREAETVILLLGAPKPGQHRARVWAGNPPNILNVAISRAKQNFYVVGSKSAWSGAGQSFQTANADSANTTDLIYRHCVGHRMWYCLHHWLL